MVRCELRWLFSDLNVTLENQNALIEQEEILPETIQGKMAADAAKLLRKMDRD